MALSSLFGLNNVKATLKPLKIWDVDGNRRVGIVSTSLKDLIAKIYNKFEIQRNTHVSLVFAEDGTEVDDEDFYQSLSLNTILMILLPGQEWKPVAGADRFEEALRILLQSNHLQDSARQIHELIEKTEDPGHLALLGKMIADARAKANIDMETRAEDSEWFEGHTLRLKTKDEVMRENARRRVRKYLNTASDHIRKNRSRRRDVQDLLKLTLREFESELKRRDWFSDYFSRLSRQYKLRFCDDQGWFRCEGVYNLPSCRFLDHYINPYGRKADYIFFSTWNLDHGVEKGREVLPRLLEAAHNLPRDRRLNWNYFFDLMFTRMNLRLVHTVCHDKSEHTTETCDRGQFYV